MDSTRAEDFSRCYTQAVLLKEVLLKCFRKSYAAWGYILHMPIGAQAFNFCFGKPFSDNLVHEKTFLSVALIMDTAYHKTQKDVSTEKGFQ